MSNDGKNLYLIYSDDLAILPLPIWLTYDQYLDCLNHCKKPRRFELLGSFEKGVFVPAVD